jgi:hypothetical protein
MKLSVGSKYLLTKLKEEFPHHKLDDILLACVALPVLEAINKHIKQLPKSDWIDNSDKSLKKDSCSINHKEIENV